MYNNVPVDFDEIRTDLIKLTDNYFKNENLDIYESSFLGWMIDSLAALSADNLFYQSFIFREAFLNQAVMKESVYNLSRFLGYEPSSAVPAETFLTIQVKIEEGMPLFELGNSPKSFSTIYPKYSRFMTQDGKIPYSIDYDLLIEGKRIGTSQGVLYYYYKKSGYGDTYIKNTAEMVGDSNYRAFLLTIPVKQFEVISYEEQAPSSVRGKSLTVEIPYTNYPYNYSVSVQEASGSYEEWTRYQSLFEMGAQTPGYLVRKNTETISFIFGNSIYGAQPSSQNVRYEIFTTLGKAGQVISDTIKQVVDSIPYVTVTCISNGPSTLAQDEPSLDSIRFSAISDFFASRRLVSEDDYKNLMFKFFTYALHVWPCLKRSDLKANEVVTFLSFFDNTFNLVPTTSATIVLDKNSPKYPTGTLYSILKVNGSIANEDAANEILLYPSGHEFTVDGTSYICPFKIAYQKTPAMAKVYHLEKVAVAIPTLVQTSRYTENTPYDPILDITSITFVKNANDNFTGTIRIVTNLNEVPASNVEYYPSITTLNFEDQVITINKVNDTTFTFTVLSKNLSKSENFKFSLTLTATGGGDEILTKQYLVEVMLMRDITDLISIQTELKLDTVADTYYLTLRNVPLIEQNFYNLPKNNSFIKTLLNDVVKAKDALATTKMFTDENKINFVRTYGELRYHDRSDYLDTSDSPTYQFTVPIKVRGKVKLKKGYSFISVYENIKKNVNKLINVPNVFMNPVYRSKIISAIQNTEGVDYCTLTHPEVNITYDHFDIKKLTIEQLQDFVPEITYTDDDHIIMIEEN